MGVARVNRVLAVSRAFGNRTLRNVIRPDAELTQRDICRDDEYLVVASDGLWDVMKNKDVADICSSATHMQMGGQVSPQGLAEELVQTALARGSMDNVTCLVVKLTNFVQRTLAARDLAALNDREVISSQQRIEKVLQASHSSNATNSGAGTGLINYQQQGESSSSSNLTARPTMSDYSPQTQTSKYFATMESKINDDYLMSSSSKKQLHQQMAANSGMNGNGNSAASSAGGSRIPGINFSGGNNCAYSGFQSLVVTLFIPPRMYSQGGCSLPKRGRLPTRSSIRHQLELKTSSATTTWGAVVHLVTVA